MSTRAERYQRRANTPTNEETSNEVPVGLSARSQRYHRRTNTPTSEEAIHVTPLGSTRAVDNRSPAALLQLELVERLIHTQQTAQQTSQQVAQQQQDRLIEVLLQQQQAQQQQQQAHQQQLQAQQQGQQQQQLAQQRHQERLMQLLETTVLSLRESRDNVSQPMESLGDRTAEVRPLAVTPERNAATQDAAPQDQVPHRVQRSVDVVREEEMPLNLSNSRMNRVMSDEASLTQSVAHHDRIGNTIRDGRDNQNANQMCGDYHSRHEIPNSPHILNVESTHLDHNRQPINLTKENITIRPSLNQCVIKDGEIESFNKSVNIVRPRVYDGTYPWAEYESQFEFIATLNKWDSRTKVGALAANLTGPALTVLTTLAKSGNCNYEGLSSALNLRFGNEHLTKLYLTQFSNRKQGKDEDLATLGHDVERLSRIALPNSDELTRDALARSRFIDAITDTELKITLSLAGSTSLRETIIKSMEIEAINKQYTNVGKLRQVGRDDGSTEKKKLDNNNKLTPEQQRQNNNDNETDNSNNTTNECKFCQKRGHDANRCFALDRRNENQNRFPNNNQASWRRNDKRQGKDDGVSEPSSTNNSKN